METINTGRILKKFGVAGRREMDPRLWDQQLITNIF